MKRQVFIAHAESEQALAEKLAGPITAAGYEVVHHGTVLVGDSIVEEAQKVLEAGGPVVLCATVKAVGTKWPHRIANAVRKSARGHVFVMHMEEEAFVEQLALGEQVAAWWQDPAKATRQLLEALKEHYPLDEESSAAALLHGAERRYRQLALEACDIINLANLPEGDRDIATRKLELRRLYVPLRVRLQVSSEDELSEARLRAVEQHREGALRGIPEFHGGDRFPIGERLARAKRLVVLGDPGAGKSTLIRWLATAYLLRLKQDSDWKDLPDIATLPDREWLPVIIRCRDLDPSALGGSLDGVLRHTFRKTEMSEAEADALSEVLRRKLSQGEALLLIDGLDEISDPGARIRFCEQLERIHVAFPGAPIVVTSRIVGYREMGGQRIGRGFEHVTVDDLSPEDKDDFVRRWCAVTEPADRRESTEVELIQDIHSTDRIERLTGNPMLLTTMALVKRKVGKLPRRRSDLYWEAVQVLLNWRRAETEDPLDLWEALPQLEFLAYAMCDRGVQRLRRDEVLSLLYQLRSEYPNLHAVRNHSPEQFLVLLERRTGILVESGHEKHLGMTVPVYEFRHLTFQEYLAARALVERCFPAAPARSLAENIAPLAIREGVKAEVEPLAPWLSNAASWEEVLRLCVAFCPNDDVDSVLLAILEPLPGEDSKVTARPRAGLAALCLVDEPNASDEVVRRILQRHVQQLKPLRHEGGYWGSRFGHLGFASSGRASVLRELAETRWGREVARVLMHEFQNREPTVRYAILGVYRFSRFVRGVISRDDFSALVSRLSASDELEVIEAALKLATSYWEAGDSPPSIDGRELIVLVERGGAVSHAAAMALERLSTIVASERVWSPTAAQVNRLVSVLASETADAGAVIVLMSILGRERVRPAVEHIITKLKNGPPRLRAAAAETLRLIHDESAVEPLIHAVEDPEPAVRKASVTALGAFEDPRVLGILKEKLQDPDEEVRSAAVIELLRFSGPEAVAALRAVTRDPSGRVRETLFLRMSERKGLENMEILVLLLNDSTMTTRLGAVRTLASLKSPVAVEALLQFLKQEPRVPPEDDSLPDAFRGWDFFTEGVSDERLLLAEAALALGQIGDRRVIEPLCAMLDGADAEVVRPAILHVLGQLGDERTVSWLLPMLDAPESRCQLVAAEALARLGDARGLTVLRQKLSSELAEERTSALELLAGLYPEEEVDSRLLILHVHRVRVVMDPRDVVDDAWLQQLQEEMKIPPDEARRSFETIVQRIPLKLSWRQGGSP